MLTGRETLFTKLDGIRASIQSFSHVDDEGELTERHDKVYREIESAMHELRHELMKRSDRAG